MARVSKIGVEVQPGPEGMRETLKTSFKTHITNTFLQFVEEAKKSVGAHAHYHMVVAVPAHETAENGGPDGGPIYRMDATLGFFAVPRDTHVRRYGDTVEIPQPPREVRGRGGQDLSELLLTAADVDIILDDGRKITDRDIDNALGKTPAKETVEKERKKLTNELLGFAVDLLKAGTGNYDGEASATLRNLVMSRLDEIIVDIPRNVDGQSTTWQETFLTKALVRLADLGRFVLDGDKRPYFEKRCIEKVGQMKADMGIFPPRPQIKTIDPNVGIRRITHDDLQRLEGVAAEKRGPLPSRHSLKQKVRLDLEGDGSVVEGLFSDRDKNEIVVEDINVPRPE